MTPDQTPFEDLFKKTETGGSSSASDAAGKKPDVQAPPVAPPDPESEFKNFLDRAADEALAATSAEDVKSRDARYQALKSAEDAATTEDAAAARANLLEMAAEGRISTDEFDKARVFLEKKFPAIGADAAREAKKRILGEKISRMQDKLSAGIAVGNPKPEDRKKVENALAALDRLKGAYESAAVDDPPTVLRKISEEGLLPPESIAALGRILRGEKEPGKQEQKPSGETKPDAGKPATPEGAPKGPATREGVREAPPRLKTPEEMHYDALRLLTYQLCEADWSVQRAEDIPASFEFTDGMKQRMENLIKEKNEYVQAFAKRIQAQNDVARLEKERDKMEREQDPKLGATEKKLVWARNVLGQSEIPDSSKLEETKEKVKVQIMDEFRKAKWAYIQENKERYIKNYSKEWMKKHHRYPGAKMTEEDKEKILKEILEEDVLAHNERVMVESVARLDKSIEYERERAAAKAQGRPEAEAAAVASGAAPGQEGAQPAGQAGGPEGTPPAQEAAPKKWWQRAIARWQKMPQPARIAISAAVGAGFMTGLATAGLITAPAGLAIYAGQRLMRGALGGVLGSAFGAGIHKATEKFTNKVTSWVFGKVHKFRRGRHIKDTRKQMKEAIGDSKEWMEDEEKKLKIAKIIDAQAREWNKKLASTAKVEKGVRIGWGVGAGVLGGLAGGYLAGNLVDAFTGRGVPPTTIVDSLEKGKGAPPVVGPLVYPDFPLAEGEPPASISQIPIPVEPGAVPGAEGYAGGEMLDFSGGEPYGPEGYHVPGGEPAAAAGEISGLADAPGGLKEYPGIYEGGYGDQPASAAGSAQGIPGAEPPSGVPLDAEDIPAPFHPSSGAPAGSENIPAGTSFASPGEPILPTESPEWIVPHDAAGAPPTGSGHALGLEGARPEDWQFSDMVKLKPDDNLTKVLGDKLNAYGKLNGLNEAQKIFARDFMKLEAAKHLSEIGLRDINQTLQVGQTLDLSSVLTQENMDVAVAGAKKLSQAGMDNIMRQSAMLDQWVASHKGQRLTPQIIDELLGTKSRVAAPVDIGLQDIKLKTQLGETMSETAEFQPPVLTTPPSAEFQPLYGAQPVPFESPELGDASPPGRLAPESYAPPSPVDVSGYPAGDVVPPSPPAGPPSASPGGQPASAISPESSSPGGGTISAEAAPVLNTIEAAFGSRAEHAIASQNGFTLGEYGAIKDMPVGEFLSQIPADRTEAWQTFSGQIEGKTITLPHYGSAHWNWEFAKQMDLAKFMRIYTGNLPASAPVLQMSISQFLQMVGPK